MGLFGRKESKGQQEKDATHNAGDIDIIGNATQGEEVWQCTSAMIILHRDQEQLTVRIDPVRLWTWQTTGYLAGRG